MVTEDWDMRFLVLLVGLMAGAAPVQHEGKEEIGLYRPAQLKWKPAPASLPPGAKIAVLEGDPTREGPFVMRLLLPDGYRIPPHVHPRTERLTVISGTFHVGMGDKFDVSAGREMPAGTF